MSPLASCTRLQILELYHNQLKTIDLIPLRSCGSLQTLSLWHNQIQTIDLVPLSSCGGLQELALFENKLKTIDLSPLFSDPKIRRDDRCVVHSWIKRKKAVYERPTSIYPWSFLHQVVEKLLKGYRIQQDILVAMSLKDYGFIDEELANSLRLIPLGTPVEEVRETITTILVETIASAVDRERATTGLRLEELSIQHSEIAAREHLINGHREAEMKKVRVGMMKDQFDLRELWLTAYGYEVLSALDMRLETDSEGLEQVEHSLAKRGFELKTGNISTSGVKMSEELKEAICWIVENRGVLWREIESSSRN